MSVSAWLLRGMKPGPKSFTRVMSLISLFMNDLEPDDVPLNFLCRYGRQWKGWEGRKKRTRKEVCVCEREMVKVFYMAMHYFSWGPNYIYVSFKCDFYFFLFLFYLDGDSFLAVFFTPS